MAVGDATSGLKSQAHGLVMQHAIFDGSGRLTDLYTAPMGTNNTPPPNNTPCTHVVYQYSVIAGQTNLVTGMKELNDVWQVAWNF